MQSRKRRKHRFWATLAGGAALALVGAGLILSPVGDRLARLSYDLPFAFRQQVPADVALVYLDQKVKASLHEPLDQPLARNYYAQLLRKLKADGARLVLFDILFDEQSSNPAVDHEFAQGIANFGPVVLVADYTRQLQGNSQTESAIPPVEILAQKAAGWGLARVAPDEVDGVIRRLDSGSEANASVGWVAANLLTNSAALAERLRGQARWLNYYCPPGAFVAVNLDEVLLTNGLTPGFFRGKLVVVGSRPAVTISGGESDQFATPYASLDWHYSSGAGIQALSTLNLAHGDWLEEMSPAAQLAAVIIWGLAAGIGLMRVRPWHAVWLAAVGALGVGAAAVYFQFHQHIWWPWLVPAAVQTPAALVWSVVWQYGLERRRLKKVRQAFAGYLSPHLADRIAEGDFELSPGRSEVLEVTVVFTDLDGFTSFSENMQPQEVSSLLTTYFNRTTRGILEQEGTIIKYLGDAIMAVWGAPLPDARQAERAVLAAWKMIQAGGTEIAGRPLRTRIGINSGPALAGNLGSDFRFDYSLIGDTINTASRIETLNKQLATDILIADTTREQLGYRFRTRALGRFRLVGKIHPVEIHEVLGVDAPPESDFSWLQLFDDALRAFTEGDLELAEKFLGRVLEAREGHDGPSEFYLKLIAATRQNPPPPGTWDGVVVVSTK